ncbi:MAG TPA: DUF5752 family protein [Candidatus Bathyarchaeia archaeon]|nr:DUF5752 family protein [Candidatus Bathyarchaeia archaeon]
MDKSVHQARTLKASDGFRDYKLSTEVCMTMTSQGAEARQFTARTIFDFKTASHLLFIERQRASNIDELLEGVKTCSEESIFQHTFRTLQEHHYIKEGFSNDFAQWAYVDLGEVGLGERLAGLDVREFTSLGAVRDRIVEIVEEFVTENPNARMRCSPTPFYFCSSRLIVLPTDLRADSLAEFVDSLKKAGLHSIQYHFIEARLRRKLDSNDFSIWLKRDVGLDREAALLNQIDIYTSTLEGVRRKIIQILQNTLGQAS